MDWYKNCSFYELINFIKDKVFVLMFKQEQGESGDMLNILSDINQILEDSLKLFDQKESEINDLKRKIKTLETKLLDLNIDSF